MIGNGDIMNKNKTVIDDGFNPELVEGAMFDGIFEIPHVPAPNDIILPNCMVPYTKMKYSNNPKDFVVFYEHDIKFRDVITSVKDHIEDFGKFSGIVNPDCSLYRDMPLTLQISNVYMSRAIGYYLWKRGLYSVPNIRWSDERSYTTKYFPQPFAFLGADKNSIVSIGSYGCIKGNENAFHFKAGLAAMLDYLSPAVVLVYGPMPDSIFGEFIDRTKFVRFDDWITIKKRAATFAMSLKESPIVEDGEIIGYETYSDII